jgi:hypothetical protein
MVGLAGSDDQGASELPAPWHAPSRYARATTEPTDGRPSSASSAAAVEQTIRLPERKPRAYIETAGMSRVAALTTPLRGFEDDCPRLAAHLTPLSTKKSSLPPVEPYALPLSARSRATIFTSTTPRAAAANGHRQSRGVAAADARLNVKAGPAAGKGQTRVSPDGLCWDR